MKAFSFIRDDGQVQIGLELDGEWYNFSILWELYKQIKNQGRGPGLNFLQIMVEADFFALETLQEVVDAVREVRPLNDLQLKPPIAIQPPIGRPQKVLCTGRNFRAHAKELDHDVPREPLFFSKSPSAIIGHEQSIVLPPGAGRVDYEGELAVVMGREAKNLAAARAFEFIAGFTVLNDVTARELQRDDIRAGRPWFRSKSFDTFCPFGPFLVPRANIADYHQLELEVRVNGERRQHAKLADMIFDIEEIVAYISKHCTLQPGDVIATGTPAGVGPLAPGDVVECSVSEIGVLRNTVK